MWRPVDGNIDGASKGVPEGKTNVHLQELLKSIQSELKIHRSKLGLEAIDTKARSAGGAAPRQAALTISGNAAKGRFILTIRNPEFQARHNAGNRSRTPIYHQVEYATSPDFSNSVLLDPGYQTYYPILEDPKSIIYAKVKSSTDGVHWNEAQIVNSSGLP